MGGWKREGQAERLVPACDAACPRKSPWPPSLIKMFGSYVHPPLSTLPSSPIPLYTWHWVAMAAPLNWKGTCYPVLNTAGSLVARSKVIRAVCQGRGIEGRAGLRLLGPAVLHSRRALTDQVGQSQTSITGSQSSV